jgi:diguanylate cyclase (GGDEF)-like protein
MDFYTDDTTIARLDVQAHTPESAAPLIELAWHVRQRDSRQAQALVERILSSFSRRLSAADQARLRLVRGEIAALAGEFVDASNHASQARNTFEAQGDVVGVGDSYMLEALLGHLQGDFGISLAKSESAFRAYKLAEDPLRARIGAAWAAVSSVQCKPESTSNWVKAANGSDIRLAALDVLLGMVDGLQAFNGGNQAHAAARFGQLAIPAETAGLNYLRIRIGIAAGAACANIDDHDNAVAWAEQTLAIARRTGWPLLIADALSLLGNLYRESGLLERSIELLNEAVALLKIAPESRGNALVHCYLGHAELVNQNPQRALALAQTAERIAQNLQSHAIVCDALTLSARSQCKLGQVDAALTAANAALHLSETQHLPIWQIDALRALAEAEAEQAGLGGFDTALHHLEAALDLAEQTSCFFEQIQILEMLSSLHERHGDLFSALQAERRARQALAGSEAKLINNQLATLELRHRSELETVAEEHRRELTAVAADRAKEYEGSRQVLENLGRIGREVTANLNINNVLHTLVSNLGKLVQVTFVGISVLESNGRLMIRRGVEEGRPMPERRISIDDPNSKAAQCARERREILSESRSGQRSSSHVPGTREMHASWFGPLVVSEELVGVLTIQSTAEHAYAEREQLIFRTLSAYVAVAVANARVYTRLNEQHARLTAVEAEMRRLATTDALTGIPNRRQFISALGQETRRSRRNGRPLSVIMADVDHFKRVNDTLGHAAGDLVLTRVARVLQNSKRAADTVGRLGGEEFAVLLPETDVAQAAEVADRLRQLIANEQIMWDGNAVPITMSFGCAAIREPDEGASESASIEAVLQEADRALYQAKNAGRNRTAWVRDGLDTLFGPDAQEPSEAGPQLSAS